MLTNLGVHNATWQYQAQIHFRTIMSSLSRLLVETWIPQDCCCRPAGIELHWRSSFSSSWLMFPHDEVCICNIDVVWRHTWGKNHQEFLMIPVKIPLGIPWLLLLLEPATRGMSSKYNRNFKHKKSSLEGIIVQVKKYSKSPVHWLRHWGTPIIT
jgi:hypothetical protein